MLSSNENCNIYKLYYESAMRTGSKYSNVLKVLVSEDQKLRNEFAKMMRNAGGWSQDLLNAFIKKYNTSADDVFNTKKVENKLIALSSKLDYANFNDEDWDNFWLLSQHADNNPIFQKQALILIKQYRGENSPLYKKLLLRIASNKGVVKTTQNTPVDLDKIDDMGINWSDLFTKI